MVSFPLSFAQHQQWKASRFLSHNTNKGKILHTTVGYLLGESEDHDLFKDPEMLKRFKDLKNIGAKEREHILFALDSKLKNIKLKSL